MSQTANNWCPNKLCLEHNLAHERIGFSRQKATKNSISNYLTVPSLNENLIDCAKREEVRVHLNMFRVG